MFHIHKSSLREMLALEIRKVDEIGEGTEKVVICRSVKHGVLQAEFQTLRAALRIGGKHGKKLLE